MADMGAAQHGRFGRCSALAEGTRRVCSHDPCRFCGEVVVGRQEPVSSSECNALQGQLVAVQHDCCTLPKRRKREFEDPPVVMLLHKVPVCLVRPQLVRPLQMHQQTGSARGRCMNSQPSAEELQTGGSPPDSAASKTPATASLLPAPPPSSRTGG